MIAGLIDRNYDRSLRRIDGLLSCAIPRSNNTIPRSIVRIQDRLLGYQDKLSAYQDREHIRWSRLKVRPEIKCDSDQGW